MLSIYIYITIHCRAETIIQTLQHIVIYQIANVRINFELFTIFRKKYFAGFCFWAFSAVEKGIIEGFSKINRIVISALLESISSTNRIITERCIEYLTFNCTSICSADARAIAIAPLERRNIPQPKECYTMVRKTIVPETKERKISLVCNYLMCMSTKKRIFVSS